MDCRRCIELAAAVMVLNVLFAPIARVQTASQWSIPSQPICSAVKAGFEAATI
jgi:hypothetical protein